MATVVYDYRTDVANLFVYPEIRSRIMKMEPAPAGRMHSHDLGGEIFLVLEGQCEFLIEDERVTCGPGQLIYVEPNVKHTLHAVGDEPCYVYLSVTPHVEPTHTQYDENGMQLPPNYGTWRGGDHGDPNPEVATSELARRYADIAKRLAELANSNAKELDQYLQVFDNASEMADQGQLKQTMDDMWVCLRSVLRQVSDLERAWNELAPRSMPEQ